MPISNRCHKWAQVTVELSFCQSVFRYSPDQILHSAVKGNLTTAMQIGIRVSSFQDRSHLPYIINQKLPADLLVRNHLKEAERRFPDNNYGNSQTYAPGKYSMPFHFDKLCYQSEGNPEPHKYGNTGLPIPGDKTKP
jgi:hypothetical protein